MQIVVKNMAELFGESGVSKALEIDKAVEEISSGNYEGSLKFVGSNSRAYALVSAFGKNSPSVTMVMTAYDGSPLASSLQSNTPATGVMSLMAAGVHRGETVILEYWLKGTKGKAAPRSMGQSMVPMPGMKGNLGGYLSTSTAGVGTVLALGVGGYLLYKAMKKR